MPHERQIFGRLGEHLAARHLADKGYRIVESNYKNRFGEIDIVAMDGETIVFVEVKARRSARFGSARASVSRAKQRKISMVALAYLKEKGGTGKKARFDVVAVHLHAAGPEESVEVIKNAFALAYG